MSCLIDASFLEIYRMMARIFASAALIVATCAGIYFAGVYLADFIGYKLKIRKMAKKKRLDEMLR